MLLNITTTIFVILVSFIILSAIENVYAEENDEKANMQRQLQDLVGIYNMNQDSSSLPSNHGSIAFVLP